MQRYTLPLVFMAAAFLAGSRPAYGNLIFNAYFESSITNDANAAAIESTINAAVAFYESAITTNITVNIAFGEMSSGLGESTSYWDPTFSYQTYITDLHNSSSGDATDTAALSDLPVSSTNPVNNGSQIAVKTANLRAFGENAPGGADPCPNGTGSGNFDGCVQLNTSITNPPNSPYSLLAVTEHEIDEVLGLGSGLYCNGTCTAGTLLPEDLFRYAANGSRSYGLNSQTGVACSGAPAAYFSLTGAVDLAQFNNCNNGGDYGDWQSGIGNPAQVQDAYASPGSTPSLGLTSPEMTALDAIGYNLDPPAVPEPTTLTLMTAGLGIVALVARRRQVRKDLPQLQ